MSLSPLKMKVVVYFWSPCWVFRVPFALKSVLRAMGVEPMQVAGQGGPTTLPAGLGGGEGGTAQRVKTGWSTAAGLGLDHLQFSFREKVFILSWEGPGGLSVSFQC